jgi:hypothetical protein
MPRMILFAGLGALMAGCVSEADLLAHYCATCAAIGFAPDTPEFRDCVLRFQTARIQGFYRDYYASPVYAW